MGEPWPVTVGRLPGAVWPWLVAAAVAAALWVGPARGPAQRLARLTAACEPSPGTAARSSRRGGLHGRLHRHPVAATDLAAVVGELAGLVRAGVPAPAAWGYAAAGVRADALGVVLAAAAAAASSGLSVADALDRHAQSLPADVSSDLGCLAGSWRVAERTGAPVADVLARVAHTIRDAADARDARSTAMAAPLATARILALLPVLGLGLGQAMGASPVQVLLGTPVGRVSGGVGLAFAAVGALWTRRLVRSAGRPG